MGREMVSTSSQLLLFNMEKPLIDYLDSIIGIPYRLNGRGGGDEGLDCIGTVLKFYREYLKIHIFDDTEVVPKNWWDNPKYADYMERMIKKHCFSIKEPELFCLILVAPPDHFLANHLGIYLGENKFLNTSETTGIIISNLGILTRENKVRGYLKVNE